jgi:hypothetical protein
MEISKADPITCYREALKEEKGVWGWGGSGGGKQEISTPEMILFIPVEISLPLLPRVPSQKLSLWSCILLLDLSSLSCLPEIKIYTSAMQECAEGLPCPCWDGLRNCFSLALPPLPSP